MYQVLRHNTINSMNSIAADVTSQRVQIFISARNLLDLDVFSKSDPYVKVYFKIGPGQQERYLGKTETIDNNLNPNFNKSFILDFIFQANQQLRFQVFDQDEGGNDDFIGSVKTTLGAIAGAKSQTHIVDLQAQQKDKKAGKLILRMQVSQDCNFSIAMKWKARKLMNTDSWFDFWDKSDPYLKILKIRTDNSLIQAAKTQVVMDNLNPIWKPLLISKNRVANPQNQTGRFKVQCWDWEEGGDAKHQFIGQTYLQLKNFISPDGQNNPNINFPIEFPLTNKKHKRPGILILQQLSQIHRPSFLQYLRGGLQLNLNIAIDFTGSNGIPTNSNSLHYMNVLRPNQYQMAIQAVGRILLNYDSDQRIPCYGFGAKVPPTRQVSHCFPLSLDPNQMQAFGLEHLMSMYARVLPNLQLAGPTFFTPIITQAINSAKMSAMQGSNCYQILLILTDGQIHDMDQVTDLIVNNCELPLSIIIVGVGNADFGNMQKLDGDNGLYSSQGKRASRDIVQFVPFRDCKMNPDVLAKEVLAQLPGQVTSYMGMIGKMPNPIIQFNVEQMLMQAGNFGQQPQQQMQMV